MKIAAFLALLFISEFISATPSPNTFGIKCPVIFDGRISNGTKPADFDKATSLYNYATAHGYTQTFADIIKIPEVQPSMWDAPKNATPVEVTINDKSIYSAGQPKYLRGELLPTNWSYGLGNTTFHWSVRNDPARPLNFSHLYQGAYIHAGYNSQFKFLTGTPFHKPKRALDPRTLSIAGTYFSPTVFDTPFYFDIWHNFAVTVGWTTNTLTVHYSTGYNPLQRVAGPVFNNNAGGGYFSIGIFKFPTGKLDTTIATQGYQESNVNEGLIYGGIFIEDSAGGCISTKE